MLDHAVISIPVFIITHSVRHEHNSYKKQLLRFYSKKKISLINFNIFQIGEDERERENIKILLVNKQQVSWPYVFVVEIICVVV